MTSTQIQRYSGKTANEQWTPEQFKEHYAKRKQPTGSKRTGNGSKAKAEMELALKLFGKPYETEYKFHPDRKWRFDWAILEMKVAIEYNGIMSTKSRHTTITGYSKDMEKINAAQKLGWKVLQYTPLNYKDLSKDLIEIVI